MPIAAEPEDRRRAAQDLGDIRHRRDPDPARYEKRPRNVQVEAVSERSEDVDRVTGRQSAESARPGADRIDEELELTAWRATEAHRAREHSPRRLEHEELPRDAGFEIASREPEERVRADLLGAERSELLATRVHASIPMRSCSDSADSALAFAIACTAAAAPEIVVTHGTRATSAASRMR